jgi:hypothetical protein
VGGALISGLLRYIAQMPLIAVAGRMKIYYAAAVL